MARGQAMSLDNMYVFDLESCDDVKTINQEHPNQHVWLCGFQQLSTGEINRYTDLSICLNELLAKGGNSNIEVGIHNLSFDGSFIVPALVAMGYTPIDGKPDIGEFSVLIDNRNNWYSIHVKATAKRTVLFWDTVKLFPLKLEYIHTVYGTQSQKIIEEQDFYTKIRPEGYQPSINECSYFDADLETLRQVLLKHIELEGPRFKKTQASQAWANFTEHFKAYRYRFPPLSEEVDKFIRKAYNGGLSYVNPAYAGVEINNVIGIDENSEYPAILAYRKLPYDYAVRRTTHEPPRQGFFWVTRAIVRFTLKPHCVPCVARRSVLDIPRQEKGQKWLRNSHGLVELTFSSIDYQTFLMSYNFEIVKFLETYWYKQKVQKEITEYIEQNNTDKVKYRELERAESDPQLKAEYAAKSYRAKINNNAFYGKFGEDIVKLGKTVHVLEDQSVVYIEDREEVTLEYRRKYLPVAVATTAYARYDFVRMANALGTDFIYGDTDSNYLKEQGWPKVLELARKGEIKLDPLELGAWDRDKYMYTRFKALRPKAYIALNEKGEQSVTLAGCPADAHSGHMSKTRSCFNFDNFKIGSLIPGGNGKMRSVLTPTGKRLVPVDFEIKEDDSLYGTF